MRRRLRIRPRRCARRPVSRAEDPSVRRRKGAPARGASERRNSCPGAAQKVEEEHAPARRHTATPEREEERRNRPRADGAWTGRIAISKKKPAGWRAFDIDYWPRFVPDGRAFLFGAADLAGFFVFAAATFFSFFGAAFFFGFSSAAPSGSSDSCFFGAGFFP